MKIRTAQEKDIKKVLALLSQVLEIHATIRPDLFIPGTTKYTHDELKSMFTEDNRRIYVAVDDQDEVLGYAFCEIRQQKNRKNLVLCDPFQ